MLKAISISTVLIICGGGAVANDSYLRYPKKIADYTGLSWSYCNGRKASRSSCVVDGDTVRIEGNTLRIAGIDTPETYRASCTQERIAGEKAKRALMDILRSSKMVRVTYYVRPKRKDIYTDRYRRPIVSLSADGLDISRTLVNKGLAVVYHGGRKVNWCGRGR